MKYFITGGCGFLGSNLAQKAMSNGAELLVLDNLSRLGSKENLDWLKAQGKFEFLNADVRDFEAVAKAVETFKPNVIFHLAGQVAMTTSIQNPRADFEINALGSLNVLEAVRNYSPQTQIVYSSTNKVYGDLEWVKYQEQDTRYVAPEYPEGFSENIPLSFSSPYGTSKGSADQYMLDYHKTFGLNTVVLRHSSMYGGRQFATYDQGWIGWFCQQALLQKNNPAQEPFTISGNGKQVRDVLHADDMVSLYFSLTENSEKVKGQVFNIGGGMANSLSLLELFGLLEKELGIKLKYSHLPVRMSDQKIFVADLSNIKKAINWEPKVNAATGIKKMLDWLNSK